MPARQLAQRHREIARGPFDPVGVSFQFVGAVVRALGDGGERRFDLRVQSLGGRFRLLLGVR